MFNDLINRYVEYIKKIYLHIYDNYNYKQLFLFLLVFLTIYVVEKLTRFNALMHGAIPVIPGLPGSAALATSNAKQPTKPNTTLKTKKSKK
jgi:hypothetical protein